MVAMVKLLSHIPEQTKLGVDVLAAFGWMSALLGVLTNLFALGAAILSFAWCALRLYETKSVQLWLEKRKAKRG